VWQRAYYERFALQRWIVANFNCCVKCIHVNMYDGSCHGFFISKHGNPELLQNFDVLLNAGDEATAHQKEGAILWH
jgi:hypothetical protein